MLVQRHTELSANIVLFCRYLRRQGFGLGPVEEADALHALGWIDIGDKLQFRKALRAVLVKNKFQHQHFDAHYADFWKELDRAVDSKTKEMLEQGKSKPNPKSNQQGSFESLKNWLYGKEPEEEAELAAYSGIETLGHKDFGKMTEEELRLVMRLLQRLARRLTHQKSRLSKASKRARQLDLKRTFRANLRQGTSLQQLRFSEKKDRKLRLVLLCDVSKSMDLYSRFFVYLIYAFQNAYDKIETFVFSTALHRVTEILDYHDFSKAFDLISERVPQWSGGTQIGFCFQQFTDKHAWQLLNKKTVVLILSDGWDTGEPEVLQKAMRQIKKRSKKVIWLNPLAGNPDYQPEVTGLQVALPHVDVFAAAHNLESLEAVLRKL